MPTTEKPNDQDEQKRVLREEYERLLRLLDQTPADSGRITILLSAKPNNSPSRWD